MLKKAAASGKDRFGDLTNDLLRHVLSYLPKDDALQTCVLGARWRGLWRRATSLRFILDERSRFPRCERFERLVKLVIRLRGDSPIVRCEISVHPDDETETEGTYTNTMRLIEYALRCQVKDLLVGAVQTEVYPLTFDAPLISQHLRTIDFFFLPFAICADYLQL
ncbi:hypothetical protein CFC21_085120 [Triticum aestivum]|uniref:F-box domain-containing protein n=3 Tax=Triticum TaxID=4564 RepID=A0A9R1B496_TRITD|nr:F-box/LRR-repeat protein At3g58940-like [Triticum aestivum]KAF7081148.1 hypothetical protein CFC21_085120 [Triticum aestivum]VAI50938.1 unnamed protein product [Triticum turgidum subsp. durum]